MKKTKTMKTVNLLLGIVFILTVLAFAATMFLPFFNFDPPAAYYEQQAKKEATANDAVGADALKVAEVTTPDSLTAEAPAPDTVMEATTPAIVVESATPTEGVTTPTNDIDAVGTQDGILEDPIEKTLKPTTGIMEEEIVVNEDGKVVYTLMEYIFTKCTLVNEQLKEVVPGYYGTNPETRVKGYAINDYVTILAVVLGLGLTTIISHICSRKCIFTQISSLAYCVFAVLCAFTAKVFTLPTANLQVQTYMIIAAIASVVVFLARLYPWFIVRFRTKITLEDIKIPSGKN